MKILISTFLLPCLLGLFEKTAIGEPGLLLLAKQHATELRTKTDLASVSPRLKQAINLEAMKFIEPIDFEPYLIGKFAASDPPRSLEDLPYKMQTFARDVAGEIESHRLLTLESRIEHLLRKFGERYRAREKEGRGKLLAYMSFNSFFERAKQGAPNLSVFSAMGRYKSEVKAPFLLSLQASYLNRLSVFEREVFQKLCALLKK